LVIARAMVCEPNVPIEMMGPHWLGSEQKSAGPRNCSVALRYKNYEIGILKWQGR